MNPNESQDVARRRYGSFDTVQRGRAFFDRFFTRRSGTYEELLPLPDQTGNTGKYLTTNGTDASWGTVSGGVAGSDKQVQFNDGGSLAGDDDFTWDKTSKFITLGTGLGSDVGITGAGGDALWYLSNGRMFLHSSEDISVLADFNHVGNGIAISVDECRVEDIPGGDISLSAGNGTAGNAAGGSIFLEPGTANSSSVNMGAIVKAYASHQRIIVGLEGATTNATPTSLEGYFFTLGTSSVAYIEARITAIRTGGTSGSAQDSASYVRRATYKRVGSGSPTLVGSIDNTYTAEDQAGWDATFVVNGNDIEVQVTGATDNDISWFAEIVFTDI
jgi:hypothetical protein